MKLLPFTELRDERLLLRRIVASDEDMIFYLRSDVELNKFIKRAEKDKTKTIEDARKFIAMIDNGLIENRFISWGITLIGKEDIIGSICLWNFSEDLKTGEIGYGLSPLFQKKGIMNAAMKLVLTYGFDTLQFTKIEAYTHQFNESSKALLIRNGFRLNENRSDEGNNDNRIFEVYSYSTNSSQP